MKPVSDPSLLQQLESRSPVADPRLLQQLDAPVPDDPQTPRPGESFPDFVTRQHPRFANYSNAVTSQLGKWGTALGGLGVNAGEATGLISPETAARAKDALSAGYRNLESTPVDATSVEGFLGKNVFGNLPALAMPGGPIVGSALGGAGAALADTDPAASMTRKATNAVVGGGTGALTAGLLGKLAAPAKNALTPEEQRLANAAMNEGIQLTPAQQTGNAVLGKFEDKLGNQALRSAQPQQFNQAVLSRLGVKADAATPDVLDDAYQTIGGTIGNITKSNAMPVDNQLINELLKVSDDYGNTINPMVKPQFDHYLNAVTKGDSLPGEAYQNTRSQLGRIMKSAYNTDPHYAQAVEGLQDAIDGAMARALPPDQAAALQTARQQYGNLKAVMKSNPQQGTGNISPRALASALKAGNATGYVTGKGDLNDLSRIGMALMKGAGPDKAGSMLPEMLAGGASYLSGGGPIGAAGAAGAANMLPSIARALYSRPGVQKMVVSGVPQLTPQMQQLAAILAAKATGLATQ